jgi:hypothetical protein
MKSVFRTIALELGRVMLKLAVDRVLRKELPAIFAKIRRGSAVFAHQPRQTA